MNIRTKTADYEITSEVSSYLDERLQAIEKILGNNADNTQCDITLGKGAAHSKHGAHMWFAEITISQPGEDRVNATAETESLNAAIDKVKDEILKQLRNRKKFHQRVLHKGGAAFKRLIRGE
jgi:ribosomal subunit interface protein